MNYTIHCDEAGEGETGFVIYVDQMPGVVSQGESLPEALEMLADAVRTMEAK